MPEKKPPAERWESFVERQIREAVERGEFDGLAGMGKPIPDLHKPLDEAWWIKEKLRREQFSHTPPTLTLRKEVEDALEAIDRARSEAEVARHRGRHQRADRQGQPDGRERTADSVRAVRCRESRRALAGATPRPRSAVPDQPECTMGGTGFASKNAGRRGRKSSGCCPWAPNGRFGLRQRVLHILPQGGTLPPESWGRRHHGMLVLLWAHALVIPLFALARGYSLGHSLLESLVVPTTAVIAGAAGLSRRARTVAAAVGLLSSSAVLVHLSGGLIEMHFHFFVMVAVVSLYQDWLTFLVAVGYVLRPPRRDGRGRSRVRSSTTPRPSSTRGPGRGCTPCSSPASASPAWSTGGSTSRTWPGTASPASRNSMPASASPSSPKRDVASCHPRSTWTP